MLSNLEQYQQQLQNKHLIRLNMFVFTAQNTAFDLLLIWATYIDPEKVKTFSQWEWMWPNTSSPVWCKRRYVKVA